MTGPSLSVRGARALALLEALVRFPSLSGEEGDVADWLTAFLHDAGVLVHRIDDNIWFSIGEGDDTLLLNSHLDVVPASGDHPYPPFVPTVADGSVYGRGTVDAKGCVAAMTVAALELVEDGWQPPDSGRVVFAFTTCEESGWPYNGLETTRPHMPAVSAALVGEPTSLRPVTSQKGLLILRAEAEGRSAHAARSALGINAIERAAEDIRRLVDYRPKRVHPDLGETTVTVTMIEGGTARNVVPDRCRFHLDVRSTPAYTHAELVTELSEVVESRIEVHSDRLVPVETLPDARIVRAVLEALPGSAPVGSPTVSDWVFLRDVPVVKIGPGESRLSHTAAEHMPLDSLEAGADAYRRIIESYFRTPG